MSHTHTIAKARRGAVRADYLELVRSFPIRPLRSQKDYTDAGAVLDKLIGREDLTDGERDYMEAVTHFMEDYERSQKHAQMERLSPLELLKHLMEESDMSTTDLGHVLGSRGLASEVLNGKRGLSKTLIARLAKRFAVEPGLFLGQSS